MIKKVICITTLLVSTITFCDDDYAKEHNLAIVPYTGKPSSESSSSNSNRFITYQEEEEEDDPVKYSQPKKQIDPQIQGIVNALEETGSKVANGKKFLDQIFPILEKELGSPKLSETEHQLVELMNTAYAVRILALEMERDRRLLSLMFMDPEVGNRLVMQAIERGVTLKDNKNQLQANPLNVLEMWGHMIQKLIQERQAQ